jgi:hypothetical protein
VRLALYVLHALTCPHTGVYIAALPGKSGGCLSDQAGDYGRAVIETN